MSDHEPGFLHCLILSLADKPADVFIRNWKSGVVVCVWMSALPTPWRTVMRIHRDVLGSFEAEGGFEEWRNTKTRCTGIEVSTVQAFRLWFSWWFFGFDAVKVMPPGYWEVLLSCSWCYKGCSSGSYSKARCFRHSEGSSYCLDSSRAYGGCSVAIGW